MTDCQQLLAAYARRGDEDAFAEIVRRYLRLVNATALRLVNGRADAAEDICQIVFTDLARLAPRLPASILLGGWLHRHTCFVASNVNRRERAQFAREQRAVEIHSMNENHPDAWQELAPHLDEAINRLSAGDRKAILLRFFEQHDFKTVGAALGNNEDAARMRVTRALEKLRLSLRRRKVVISSGGLATALTAGAEATVRADLAATVSKLALATHAANAGSTLGLFKIMGISKLKATAISAVVVSVLLAPALIQHQSVTSLRLENQALQTRLAALASQRESGSNSARLAQADATLTEAERSELLKLRGEVAALRREKAVFNASSQANRSAEPGQPVASKLDPIPSEKLQFVGYATPENALQSIIWAMKNGDLNAYLSGLSPESRKNFDARYAGKTGAEISAALAQEITGLAGVKFERKPSDTPGAVTFVLGYHEENNGLQKLRDEAVMRFTNIGSEWKFTE